MQYFNGQRILVGDKVRLGDSDGIVVCSIDDAVYTPAHPAAQWSYLKEGVMIEFQKYGLIHHTEMDEDLVLIERKTPE